jgi:hypothetical protein
MALLNVQEYRVYLTAEDLSDLLRNFPDLALDLGRRIVPKHTAVSPLSENSESPLFPGSQEDEIPPSEPLRFRDVTEDDSRAEEEHSESEEGEVAAQKEEGIGREDQLEAESEAQAQSQGVKKKRQKKENETAVLKLFQNLEDIFQSLVQASTQHDYEIRLRELRGTLERINFRKMTMAQKKEFLERIETFRKNANPKRFPADVSFLTSFSLRGPSVKEEEAHLQRLSENRLVSHNKAAERADKAATLKADREKSATREERMKNAKDAASSLDSYNQTPLEYVKKLLMIASAVEELESNPVPDRDGDIVGDIKKLVRDSSQPPRSVSAQLAVTDYLLLMEVIENLKLKKPNKFENEDKLKSLVMKLEALETEEREKKKQEMEKKKQEMDKLRMDERSQEFDVRFKKLKGFVSSHSDDPNISLLKKGFNDARERYSRDDSKERNQHATTLIEKVLQDWKRTIEPKIQRELINVETALLHDKTKPFRALTTDEKNSFRVDEKMGPEEYLRRLNLFYREEFIDAVKKRMNREYEKVPLSLWLPEGHDIDHYYKSDAFATLRHLGQTKNDILRPLKFPWFRYGAS